MQNRDDEFEKYRVSNAVSPSVDQDEFEQYRANPSLKKNEETENTFIGQLPRKIPELGSPENKNFVRGLINSVGRVGVTGGMNLQPEVELLKKFAPNAPKLINMLTRVGVQGGIGALASPEDPELGAAIGSAVPLAAPVIGLIGKGITGAKNIVTGVAKDLTPLQQEAEATAAAHTGAQESEFAAKERAKQELGQSDYATMEYNLNKNKENLAKIDKKLEEDIPSPESYLLDTPEESEKRFLNSKIAQEQAEKQVKNIDNQVDKHLDSGAVHDVEVARETKKDLKSLKDEGSNKYEDIEKDIANRGVVLGNSRDAKQIMEDIRELVKQGELNNLNELPEGKKLLQELEAANKKEIVPAGQYMSAVKAVKGYMREAYEKAYEPGINEEKRQFYKSQGDEAKEKLEEMNKILENGIGKENYAKLKEANDYWRTNIVPLYNEPLYWKILNKEKMSENIASELRGGPPGSGIEIIRNVIKNNPKSVKHVVGQLHDAGNDIHNPNELIREYTDLVPGLRNLSQAKQEAANLANKAAQRTNLHQTFKTESEKLNKSYKAKIDKKEDLESQKKDLEKTISLLEKHIPELKKASESRRLSLKDKILAKNRLKRAEIKKANAIKKLLYIGGTLVGTVLTKPAINIGKSLFSSN